MKKHLNLFLKTVFAFFIIIIVPFITQASIPVDIYRHQNNRDNLNLEQAATKGDLDAVKALIKRCAS